MLWEVPQNHYAWSRSHKERYFSPNTSQKHVPLQFMLRLINDLTLWMFNWLENPWIRERLGMIREGINDDREKTMFRSHRYSYILACTHRAFFTF